MKKILALLMAIVMALSLAACGGNSNNENNGDDSNAEGNVTPTVSFSEQVVLDNDYCTVKAVGFDAKALMGPTLKVEVANKSADTNILATAKYVAINGMQVEIAFAATAEAGESQKGNIVFPKGSMKKWGVTDITDIFLAFDITKDGDWSGAVLESGSNHVYTTTRENATVFSRPAKDTDIVLLDNDDVKIILDSYDPANQWGYAANIYIINKSDDILSLTGKDSTVNGYSVDPEWSFVLNPGMTAFDEIVWDYFDMDDFGIVSMNRMTLTINGFHTATNESLFEEEVIFEPNK